MLTINLTDLEKSDIKYKISTFPDGQQNIIIDSNWCKSPKGDNGNGSYNHPPADFSKEKVQIKARLNNWLNLELIVATVASLRELGVKEIHLYVPYFLGARSDRKFEEGGNWYLKQVICPIINSLNFESVTVLDAHSYVLGNLLKNYKAINNEQLFGHSIGSLYGMGSIGANLTKNAILISPDAGASHKIEKLANAVGYTGDIITCTKERDTEGRLTKTVVPLKYPHIEFYENKDFVIVDDICDGGRTFINIAKEIMRICDLKQVNMGKIYLIVTHGIFSAGFTELSKYFDGIYCTNSYSDIGDYAGNDKEKTNVKQLKVI